jgi:hypothetical protein
MDAEGRRVSEVKGIMKRISVLIPSYGQPRKAMLTIMNLVSLAEDPHSLEFVIAASSSDPARGDYEKMDMALQSLGIDSGATTCGCSGYEHMKDYYRQAYEVSTGTLLFLYNDDVRILTPGWDLAYYSLAHSSYPVIGAQNMDESPSGGRYSWAFPMIGRDICEKLGEFFLCTPEQGLDRVAEAYAIGTHRNWVAPVTIRHYRPEPDLNATDGRSRWSRYAQEHWPELLAQWKADAEEIHFRLNT